MAPTVAAEKIKLAKGLTLSQAQDCYQNCYHSDTQMRYQTEKEKRNNSTGCVDGTNEHEPLQSSRYRRSVCTRVSISSIMQRSQVLALLFRKRTLQYGFLRGT